MRLRKRIRSEGGFAVPTVLLMMIAAMAIASVAAFASISSQNGTVRDQRSKSAFGIAESGVSNAMLHYNLVAASPGACSPLPGATGPDSSGWCHVAPTASVNGGTVELWVHPASSSPSSRCATSATPTKCIEIVSQGVLNNASRRVDVTATTATGSAMFADAAVKSQNGLILDSNAEIHSGTATNGDITLASNAKQCGAASVGIGHTLTTAGASGYFSDANCTTATTSYGQQALNLPPVNQGDAPSHNDNARFFALDPVSGNRGDVCWNGADANGVSSTACGGRELAISQNSSLTLSGTTYSFCKLTMSQNSKLYIAAGANVTIFFDTPEACGYGSGTAQLTMSSNTRISTATTSPSSIALLFVGSTTLSTTALLSSNTDANAACQQNFIVYGPLTDIEMNSNSTYCGAVAGKTIHMDSNARLYTGNGTGSFTLPNQPDYFVLDPDGYVECSAATASPVNSGC